MKNGFSANFQVSAKQKNSRFSVIRTQKIGKNSPQNQDPIVKITFFQLCLFGNPSWWWQNYWKWKKKWIWGKKMHFWPFWAGIFFFFYATPIYRGGKHYENFRVPQILLVGPIWRCFGQKITPVGRFLVPFRQYQKFGFPYCRAKNQSCRRPLEWPIKTSAREALGQWKKLELNRTYQFGEKSKKPSKTFPHIYMGIFGKSDWALVFSIGLVPLSRLFW